jgi:hypothetical protein
LFILILNLLLSINLNAQEPDQNKLKELAYSKQWLKLVHYQKSFWGSYKSNADTENFFLAKDGKYNPLAELKETFNAFRIESELLSGSPACRFPARFSWIKKHFLLPNLDLSKCKDFEAFREKINPEKAFVVFSSYFINTPASAFGHTLLRFQRKTEGETTHSELLDYGVNYAAVVTSDNALIYAVMGLAGGFNGLFTAIPYYYKIREYNDFESRDLYSYELNLNQEELNFMLAHLWELGQTSFDYFYLTQNCSYHVLNLIEVAKPELDLMNKIPFYVIPVDTVKALYTQKDLVRKVDYRPSLRTKLYNETNNFSTDEIKNIKKLAENSDESHLMNLSNSQKAKAYDIAIDYYDYIHAKEILFNAGVPERKRNLLLKRSEIALESPTSPINLNETQLPHLSHAPERFMFAQGTLDNRVYSSIEFRFALHDLLDSTIGQPPNLHIDFGKIRFNYFHETKKTKLDELTVFQVLNLSPMNKFDTPFSWRANLGAKRIYDQSCSNCLATNTELAGGLSLNLDKDEKFRLFSFIDGEINAGKFKKNNFRLGVGPLVGFYSEFNANFLMLNQIGYKYYIFVPEMDNVFFKNEFRLTIKKDIAVGLQTLHQNFYNQYQGNFFWYF